MSIDKTKIFIAGTGSYVPEKILTNADFEKMVDTTNEWIIQRTGIEQRHIAAPDEATSDLGYKAALNAIDSAGISISEIDLIIVATVTPDMSFPSTACIIQNKLNAVNAACFDLSAACTGFIYALSVAKDIMSNNNNMNTALIIAAETLSRITDYEDRSMCVLFGDGAGAAILKKGPGESHIHDYILKADGSYGDLLKLPAGGSRMPASEHTIKNKLHFINMDGNAVFKVAIKSMSSIAEEILLKNNMNVNNLDMVIFHQANIRILDFVRKRLQIPEDKVYINIQKYGNTSAATIAIALDEVVKKELVKKGSNILVVAFGGGFTWGALLLTL
ncbi:ketoacyl-ACP synthase III [Candidatus Dependentiae bacterium]|nr:ketoacyl-ACP synthase III [Candidatus Dependentiae bacterium]